MLKNLTLLDAAIYSTIIAGISLLAAVIVRIKMNRFCRKHEIDATPKTKRSLSIGNAFALLLFSITGLFIGNLLSILMTFGTALSHGMTVNPDTGKYDLSYGQILSYNKTSVKETNIDVADLKEKAIIYVRYDCPDCIKLHDQLSEIKDIIFLSSRSDLGKTARSLYDINLTEVPQGVYIDANGKSTTISIIQHTEEDIMLDLQQIAILREMANCHVKLSTE